MEADKARSTELKLLALKYVAFVRGALILLAFLDRKGFVLICWYKDGSVMQIPFTLLLVLTKNRAILFNFTN